MPSLHERWLSQWDRIEAHGNPETPFADLLYRYSEPWRAYHTLTHIEAMFADFDEFKASAEFDLVNPEPIEMGIWYHDSYYNPTQKENEEESVRIFMQIARHVKMPRNLTKKTAQLILSTKHTEIPADLEARVLCDIDLAILGKSEATFDSYEEMIRLEYKFVPDDQFRVGRLAILQSFRQRPLIYSTEFFQGKYENRAQANLLRSVEKLSRHL